MRQSDQANCQGGGRRQVFWRRLLGWGGAVIGAVLVGSIPTGTAHQPITTQVMFNREIIRILDRNCLACHSPGHLKADIPLTTYRQARPWAKAIKEEVLERRMVPFQVVKGYGEFRNPYSLTQREQELLLSWIEGGAPKGDEKDYPQASIRARLRGEWLAGKEPDHWLPIPEAVRIPAGMAHLDRCVVVEAGNKAPFWVEQFDFQPGNREVVSRADYFLAPAGRAGGDPCGWPTARLAPIGNWVPGAVTTPLPPGMGYRIPAGARLVIRLRYQGIDRETTDQSRLGWHLMPGTTPGPAPLAVGHQRLAGPAGIALQDGERQRRVSFSEEIRQERQAIGLRPLLFPYATSIEVKLERPDGASEVLLVARGYHYDWQPAYHFKQPVQLPRGSRLHVIAYLDNSAENPALAERTRRRVLFREPLLELISAPRAVSPTTAYSN